MQFLSSFWVVVVVLCFVCFCLSSSDRCEARKAKCDGIHVDDDDDDDGIFAD